MTLFGGFNSMFTLLDSFLTLKFPVAVCWSIKGIVSDARCIVEHKGLYMLK